MAQRQLSEAEAIQHELNSKRRVHPGTKSADVAAGPPLMPLNELDSAFQLQEHLAALHYYHSQSRTQPITRTTAIQLATPPAQTDRTLWLYELCRFLISQCNSLIVGFLFDTPPCSATTCPEMRASEWQFLCAVHEQPKSCCAIDYCCHTLDWAANVVTDPKIFPSRLVALQDAHSRSIAMKSLVNVFRRLHRIFAHAWFQHRTVFWTVENQTGLYVFFKTVCDMYDLLPGETYKLPPEAEGLEGDSKPGGAAGGAGPGGEKKSSFPGGVALGAVGRSHHGQKSEGSGLLPGSDEDPHHPGVGRTNTRRHIRSNPSTGSAVTTVMEADEEDGGGGSDGHGKARAKPQDGLASKMKDLQISAPEPVEEEPADAEEVPVIVEQDVMEAPPPSRDTAPEPEMEEPETARPGDDGRSKQEEFPLPEEPVLPPEDAKLQKATATSTGEAASSSAEEAAEPPGPTEKEGDEPAKTSPTSEDADDSESEERVNTPDSGSTAADADVGVHDFVDPGVEPATADALEGEKKEQETTGIAAEPATETKEEVKEVKSKEEDGEKP